MKANCGAHLGTEVKTSPLEEDGFSHVCVWVELVHVTEGAHQGSEK